MGWGSTESCFYACITLCNIDLGDFSKLCIVSWVERYTCWHSDGVCSIIERYKLSYIISESPCFFQCCCFNLDGILIFHHFIHYNMLWLKHNAIVLCGRPWKCNMVDLSSQLKNWIGDLQWSWCENIETIGRWLKDIHQSIQTPKYSKLSLLVPSCPILTKIFSKCLFSWDYKTYITEVLFTSQYYRKCTKMHLKGHIDITTSMSNSLTNTWPLARNQHKHILYFMLMNS